MLRKNFTLQQPVDNFAVPLELFLKDVATNALQSYQGIYKGTGKSGTKISPISFSPKIVVISPFIDVGRATATTAGNMVFALAGNAGITWIPGTGFVKDGVISYQNDGFTLGANANCNTNGTTYVYFVVG